MGFGLSEWRGSDLYQQTIMIIIMMVSHYPHRQMRTLILSCFNFCISSLATVGVVAVCVSGGVVCVVVVGAIENLHL